jgi:hypothetical protein
MAGTRQENRAVRRPLKKQGRDCQSLGLKIKGLSDRKGLRQNKARSFDGTQSREADAWIWSAMANSRG